MTGEYRVRIERVLRDGLAWWMVTVCSDGASRPISTAYCQTRIGAKWEGWQIARALNRGRPDAVEFLTDGGIPELTLFVASFAVVVVGVLALAAVVVFW